MTKKTIIITGASDGIGKSAAKMLVADGHKVVVVGNSPAKTKAVADELRAPYYTADFSDLSQVRALADRLLKDYPTIDVLANNAGGIFGEHKLTKDGFEITMQVNYLATFLLTYLLLPTLIRSKAVVIQTSSIAAQRFGNLDVNDLNSEKSYDVNRVYGNSKVALNLFTRELNHRYNARGLSAVSFHPGVLATSFAKESSSWFRFMYNTPLKHFMGGADKGARALKWLIDGVPGKTWIAGEYYENNAFPKKINPQTTDMDLAKKLWEKTEKMLLPFSSTASVIG